MDVEFWNTTVAPFIGKKYMPVFSPVAILDYMQPVSIRVNTTFSYMTPFICNRLMSTDGNKTAKLATDMDIASWKACRVQDIPSTLLDVSYPMNSHIWFSSNNSLFLIYVTLFVTWALCTAYLPFLDRIFTLKTGSLWIFVAIIALVGNLSFVVIIPNSFPELNVPVNNVVIGVCLHLLALVMVSLVARQRDNVVVHMDHHEWIKEYFGYRISPDGLGIQHLWRIAGTNKFVTQSVFSSSSSCSSSLLQQPSTLLESGFGSGGGAGGGNKQQQQQWVTSKSQRSKEVAAAVFSGLNEDDGGSGSAASEGQTPLLADDEKEGAAHGQERRKKVHGPLHKDCVATYDGMDFYVSKGNIFEKGFYQDRLYKHMDAVTLKYFEYAMTAGLFLTGVMFSFHPNGNLHMYQLSAAGMVACNLVAIPMHKALLFGARLAAGKAYTQPVRDAASAAAVMFLISSWFFFIAGFYAFGSMSSMARADGVPDFVVVVYYGMYVGFLLFGALGTVCTVLLVWNMSMRSGSGGGSGGGGGAAQQQQAGVQKAFMKDVVYGMSLGFEILNLIKAIIAFVILGSVSASTGFI